jgi:hypothetical protein
MLEWQLIPIVGVVAGSVVFMSCVRAVLRYIELRQQRQSVLPPAELRELRDRLARIEDVVESTAVEVERIAEANRFMSKLLAERSSPSLPRASQSERVITPH